MPGLSFDHLERAQLLADRITVFETLKAEKNRLDLIFKLMGECAEKSLTLRFKSPGSPSRGVALLFGFFDVLIDCGSRATIQEVEDRPAFMDGDPIGHRFRSFVQYGQEHTSENCQFP